jgi:hypothetical protein
MYAQAGSLPGRAVAAGCTAVPWCVRGKATVSSLCGVRRHTKRETVAVDASIAHFSPAGAPGGQPGAGDLEEELFNRVRGHAESMISWARSDEALALEHDALEERAMTDGLELMRLLAEAHLGLRALREQRRDDVRDAEGDLRRITEAGQEHTRIMIFGPVRTSRIAYRKRGKGNLCPQDAELNWAGLHSFSAGVEKRAAKAAAIVPFEQAAEQVSAAGAIRLGKRQAEELAIGAAADFEAFYVSRLPEPCPPETGLLISCDGSAFPVLPQALRPATAKAAKARAQAAAESGWPDDPDDPADLRKARKRTAELAAVADIPPAPRTAEDIMTALFGPDRPAGGDAPRPAPGPDADGKRCSRRSAGPPARSSRRHSPRRTAATRSTPGPGSPSWTATTARSPPSTPSPPNARSRSRS